jgi:hypothetical protein
METAKLGDAIEPYFLPRYEDVFLSKSKKLKLKTTTLELIFNHFNH